MESMRDAFLLSDKYIMALYTHCLVARKEAALQKKQIEGYTEKEYGMVSLVKVWDVLFQALLLDDIRLEDDKMYAEFCTLEMKKFFSFQVYRELEKRI